MAEVHPPKVDDFFMYKDWKNLVLFKAEAAIRAVRTPLLLKEASWRVIRFVVKCGTSNPISFALRPIMTHNRLRVGVGVSMAVLAVASAILAPLPLSAENSGGELALIVAPEAEVETATQVSVRIPLENYRISQKFWVFHSGLDMAALVGTPIRPVMAGKVVLVERGHFGYGNHVIVQHNAEYSSLYGHMSSIAVAEGQEVTTDTVLGAVGSTGRSTGPHLHLEIRVNGQVVNPATVLGI